MMKYLMTKLWNDDAGALIAAEYLFVASTVVIGIVVGLTGVRNAINAELTTLGNAYLALNLSYTISGETGCGASVAGSQAIDIPTLLTPPTSVPPTIPSVISVPPCS
jgi:Flp pilus assembly pilin Flp